MKVEAPINDHKEDLKKYLAQITSYKSEMNLLIQQLPGYFTFPKMDKMQFNSQWKVKGQLLYKHPLKPELCKTYVELEVNLNSKTAEEIVARKLLTSMYEDHPDIVEIMSVIKTKKSIKT